MSVIDINSVSKSFGDVKVLDEVSFKVEKGDFFGLFGPNGAGKTTLLRIITGQIAPDYGESLTLGVPHSDPIGIKSKVGIVPEAFSFSF